MHYYRAPTWFSLVKILTSPKKFLQKSWPLKSCLSARLKSSHSILQIKLCILQNGGFSMIIKYSGSRQDFFLKGRKLFTNADLYIFCNFYGQEGRANLAPPPLWLSGGMHLYCLGIHRRVHLLPPPQARRLGGEGWAPPPRIWETRNFTFETGK